MRPAPSRRCPRRPAGEKLRAGLAWRPARFRPARRRRFPGESRRSSRSSRCRRPARRAPRARRPRSRGRRSPRRPPPRGPRARRRRSRGRSASGRLFEDVPARGDRLDARASMHLVTVDHERQLGIRGDAMALEQRGRLGAAGLVPLVRLRGAGEEVAQAVVLGVGRVPTTCTVGRTGDMRRSYARVDPLSLDAWQSALTSTRCRSSPAPTPCRAARTALDGRPLGAPLGAAPVGTSAAGGSSPNRHATAHERETGHPIVSSVEPGEGWVVLLRRRRGLRDQLSGPRPRCSSPRERCRA